MKAQPASASIRRGNGSSDGRTRGAVDNELGRLRALERAYDRQTIELLQGLGLAPEASFCEVGAGAGSIAKWMRENTAGPVVAVDTDVAHLRELTGVAVIEGDVRSWQAPMVFDVVHCRFLLDLLPRAREPVSRMAEATAPGGYLVLEEFDDLSAELAFGSELEVARHEQAVAAKQAAFTRAGHHNHAGRYLPPLIQAAGRFRLHSCGRTEVRRGGDAATEPWRRYLENQRPALLATGCLDGATLDAYCEQLAQPGFVYFAPMVVRVVAQKL